MDDLVNRYKTILGKMERSQFPNYAEEDDKYSGVFLPIAFDEYYEIPIKVMLVGRETAGWNTKNNKNTLKRIFEANEANNIGWIICEAISRYKNHLDKDSDEKIITTSRSRFKQFFFKISKELSIPPKSIIYANLFAWDYDKVSPLTRLNNTKIAKNITERNNEEFNTITSISKELLATQIKHFEPNFIIFATGVNNIDPIIKLMFKEFFEGHKTKEPVISRKLWEFEAANAKCFRIAHPRAMNGHQDCREEVIKRIKNYIMETKKN